MLITEAFDIYRDDYLSLKNRSAKTVESYDATKKICAWYFGNAEIESLQLDLILAWIRYLKTEPSPTTGKLRGSNTVRNYVICFRVLLKYLKERGYDVIDPAPIPVPAREDKVPDFLKPEETARFIELAGDPSRGQPLINRKRNQAIVSLIFNSGLRVSELCSLNRGCFFNNTFTVMGKGKNPRLCFVDTKTKQYIDEYLAMRKDMNPALFVANQTGGRITPGNVRDIFSNLSKRFGKRIHPHLGRHSFATDLLANNTNPRYVQEFLGHKNLATVQVYMHVTNPDLQRIYEEKHTDLA